MEGQFATHALILEQQRRIKALEAELASTQIELMHLRASVHTSSNNNNETHPNNPNNPAIHDSMTNNNCLNSCGGINSSNNRRANNGTGEDAKKASSRYWTADEHGRFLEGLELFGQKDIKAISRHVGTRSATQVRTHAQKYYLRIARERAKAEGPNPRIQSSTRERRQSQKGRPRGSTGASASANGGSSCNDVTSGANGRSGCGGGSTSGGTVDGGGPSIGSHSHSAESGSANGMGTAQSQSSTDKGEGVESRATNEAASDQNGRSSDHDQISKACASDDGKESNTDMGSNSSEDNKAQPEDKPVASVTETKRCNPPPTREEQWTKEDIRVESASPTSNEIIVNCTDQTVNNDNAESKNEANIILISNDVQQAIEKPNAVDPARPLPAPPAEPRIKEENNSEIIEMDVTQPKEPEHPTRQVKSEHLLSNKRLVHDSRDIAGEDRSHDLKRPKLEKEDQITPEDSQPATGAIVSGSGGSGSGACLVVVGSSQLPPRLETSGSATNLRGLLPSCGLDSVGVGVGVNMVSGKVASTIRRNGSSNSLLASLSRSNSFLIPHNGKGVTRSNSILSLLSGMPVMRESPSTDRLLGIDSTDDRMMLMSTLKSNNGGDAAAATTQTQAQAQQAQAQQPAGVTSIGTLGDRSLSFGQLNHMGVDDLEDAGTVALSIDHKWNDN